MAGRGTNLNIQYICFHHYVLRFCLRFLYPEYKDQFCQSGFVIPSSYKKMLSVTIQDQKYSSGQCVFAKSVFQICTHSQSSPATMFFNPMLHAAKIEYFAVHSFEINHFCITRPFAIVHWFPCHPQRHEMGRPIQIWHPTQEHSPQNFIISLDYILCPLITASFSIEEQPVLVTIPMV